jgi:DNA ligase 1
MQSNAPVNARSCKHLKSLLGDNYENARIEMMNPGGGSSKQNSSAKSRAPNSSKKAKVGVMEIIFRTSHSSDQLQTTKAPELLLANKWDLESGSDPTGWWASEKLDGVR